MVPQKTKSKGDAAGALEVRSRILEGQGPDGSWEEDGPSEARETIATGYRTPSLLSPMTADILVRRR